MTDTPRGPRVLARAVALAGLGLAIFLVADTTRARPTAGMWRVTSHEADCGRDPSWRSGPPTLVAEPFHGELLERRDPPASARCDVYRGYLVVREASRLSLELHASGSTRVVFGKQELVALDAPGVRITRRIERPMPPGSHLIEIRSEQNGQLAYLRLSALIEPEGRATTLPLAERALLPLDHDALAPSQADAERVRTDTTFVRRAPQRLTILLVAILGVVLAPWLARSWITARAGWTSIDAPLFTLATTAALSVVGWLSWSPSEIVIDPHFVAHGARAWRTVWLSLPAGPFADAIPALGATEWTLGAAYALGGPEGPAVLANAVSASALAFLVASARLLEGPRSAAILLVASVATRVLVGPPSLDRASMASLTLAAITLVIALLLARSRLGSVASRLSPRRPTRSDPSSTTRITRARSVRIGLVAAALSTTIALGLGAPTTALAPLLLVVLVLVIVSARDAWTARV